MAHGDTPHDGCGATGSPPHTLLVFDHDVATPETYVTSPALHGVLGRAARYEIHVVVSDARGPAPCVTVEYQWALDDAAWVSRCGDARASSNSLSVGGTTVMRAVGARSQSQPKSARLSIAPQGVDTRARLRVWVTLWPHA